MKQITAILTAFILFFAAAAKAQQNVQVTASTIISGMVTDLKSRPLPGAVIELVNTTDSLLIKTTLADSTGEYHFDNVAAGQYLIAASMTGYTQNFSAAAVVKEGLALLQIPVLQLQATNKMLEAITVTAKKSFIERKIDRTVLNVENSVIAAGSSVMEVLEKAPGVIVDKDGNITMGGKSGVLVTIDGKQTYLGSNELAQLLKSMQSSQVDLIELIANPSAKYDAAGNSGIINIKTKKKKTVGTNGNITAGGGYGNNLKSNAGIQLNHRNKMLNLFGHYNFSDNKTGRILNIDRVAHLSNQNTYFSQQQTENRHFNNNDFKVGADWFINSKNTLGFLVNGYNNTAGNEFGNLTRIGNSAKSADSSIDVLAHINSRYKNIAGNINFRTVLDSTGKELTIDLDHARNSFTEHSAYNYFFLQNNGSNLRAPYFNRNSSPSTININSFKADYVYPVSKTSKVEAGIKSSIVRTDNDLQFEELENGKWKSNVTRSNHFIYEETIHAAYLNASKQFKNASMQVGVRAEQTISEGNSITENKIVKRKYFDLFPSVFVNRSFTNNHSATFSYSRRIDRPGYDALNPFVYYLDQYTYQKGNPFLNPQYSHTAELGYTYKRKYNASFRYSLTNDIITDVILPDTAKKSLYQTSANIKRGDFLSLTISAPVTVTKWWSANNTLTAFKNQYHANDLEGLRLQASKTSFYFNTNHSFTLPKAIVAEASATYCSSLVYGTLSMGSQYGVDLGVSKSLANKKANLKLSVSDVFNSRHQKIHSTLPGVDYNLVQNAETRVFRLTFNYRFGSNGIKAASNHSTGLESEQNRVKK